ncbi:MAG: hypothetical protein ACRDOF_01310 [Gaiellaceae bacterium]
MIVPTEIARDAVVLSCAVSVGIHGALAPAHFAEGAGPGAGFLAAAVVLAGVVVALARRPRSTAALALAAVVLLGLLASYALATTTGVPLLHPDPERVTGLALATKAIEAVGLLAAAHVLWRDRPEIALTVTRPKGMTT